MTSIKTFNKPLESVPIKGTKDYRWFVIGETFKLLGLLFCLILTVFMLHIIANG